MFQPGQKRQSEAEGTTDHEKKRPAFYRSGALGPLARDITSDVRQQAKESTAKTSNTDEGHVEMKCKMKFIMRETDVALGNFITRHRDAQRFQFLDVCCAPGGFSEYVVATLPNARGFGLSLPPAQGGHILKLDMAEYGARYDYHYLDVPKEAHAIYMKSMYGDRGGVKGFQDCLDLGAGIPEGAPGQCDLLIIDGSYLGNKKHVHSHETTMSDSDNPAFNVYGNDSTGHQALLVAQLLIVGTNLKAGGTLMLRLDIDSFGVFQKSLICLLRRVFDGTIHNYKPRSCHQMKGSYHAVCNNFNRVKAAHIKFVENFGALLARLRTKSVIDHAPVVPFPDLPEGRAGPDLLSLWGPQLRAFLTPIKLCKDLNELAACESEFMRNSRLRGWLPKSMFATEVCQDRIIFQRPCTWTGCERAHTPDELTAKIRMAWRVRPGVMTGFWTTPDVSEDEAANVALSNELLALHDRRQRWVNAGVDVTHLLNSGGVGKDGELTHARTASEVVKWCTAHAVVTLAFAVGRPLADLPPPTCATASAPGPAPTAPGTAGPGAAAAEKPVPPLQKPLTAPPALPADAGAASLQEWWAYAWTWFQEQPEELQEGWIEHVSQALPAGFRKRMEAGEAVAGTV